MKKKIIATLLILTMSLSGTCLAAADDSAYDPSAAAAVSEAAESGSSPVIDSEAVPTQDETDSLLITEEEVSAPEAVDAVSEESSVSDTSDAAPAEPSSAEADDAVPEESSAAEADDAVTETSEVSSLPAASSEPDYENKDDDPMPIAADEASITEDEPVITEEPSDNAAEEKAEEAESMKPEPGSAEKAVSETINPKNASDTIVSGDWQYTLENSGLVITKYLGTASEVEIPRLLDGYKVGVIGLQAFADNTSLHVLTIPDTITQIRAEAFKGCIGLNTIYFNAVNCTIPDIWIYDDNKGAGVFSGAGSAALSLEVVFGSTVKKIPEKLFETASYSDYGLKGYDYAHVTSAVIPSSVTEIGAYAFRGCKDLAKIELGSSVSIIGKKAFADCISAASLSGSAVMSDIGEQAFYNCTNLSSVNWGSSLTTIGAQAFELCTSLTKVLLPKPLNTISRRAFAKCTGLTEISLPESLTVLGGEAFCDTAKLSKITIKSTNLSVADVWIYDDNKGIGVFSGAGAGAINGISVTFASGVTKIPTSMFFAANRDVYGQKGYDYAHVTSVTLPNSLLEIGQAAFTCCSELKSITIPNSVTTIGKNAFLDCTALTSVQFGSGLKTIEASAFQNCALESVTIPANVTSVGETAFSGITALTNCTIKALSASFGNKVFDGCTNINFLISAYYGSTAADYAESNSLKYSYLKPYKAVLSSVKLSGNNVLLTWAAKTGAKTYNVYRKLSGASSWSLLGSTAETTYTDTTAKAGKIYYYTIRSAAGSNNYGDYDTVGTPFIRMAAPAVKCTVLAGGTKVTWKKAAGAAGYQILRKTGSGSFKKVKTITSGATLTWIDTKAKTNGAKYTYKIRAYKKVSGTTYYGAYSSNTVSYFLTRPAATLKSKAAGKLTVSWKKNTKVSGYQVQVSRSSSFSSIAKKATLSSKTKISTAFTKLNSGKYYYVRVRSYYKVGSKKYYSAWSKVKKIKVK